MSRDHEKPGGGAAVRHRNAGRGGCGDGARYARHDVVCDTGPLQRRRFLAAAPEHERVAALEAYHALAAPRRADQQGVNRGLSDGVTAGPLADIKALRAPGIAEDPLVDKRVVENDV